MWIKVDPRGIQSYEMAKTEYIADRLEGAKGRVLRTPAIIILRKTRLIKTIVLSYEQDSGGASICLNYGGKYTNEYFIAHRFTVSFKNYEGARTYDYCPDRTLRKIIIWPRDKSVTIMHPVQFYNKRKKRCEECPIEQIRTINPKYIETDGRVTDKKYL